MFTGLVAATGVLAERSRRSTAAPDARLVVRAALGDEPLALGESITVDGACLSVTEVLADGFAVDATAETLARTTLGALAVGARVNLERALRAGDRLGGHLVSGPRRRRGRRSPTRREVGDALNLGFALPAELARYVRREGLDCSQRRQPDGERRARRAPSTSWSSPSRGARRPSATSRPASRVNLEVDLVARYVARLMALPETAQTATGP